MRPLLGLVMLVGPLVLGACAQRAAPPRVKPAEEPLALSGDGPAAPSEEGGEGEEAPARGFAPGSTNGPSTMSPVVGGQRAEEVPQTLDEALEREQEKRYGPPPPGALRKERQAGDVQIRRVR